jgi:hypothetical protein
MCYAHTLLGCTRSNVSLWMRRHAELRNLVYEAEGEVTDLSIGNIVTAIKGDNPGARLSASLWWLGVVR